MLLLSPKIEHMSKTWAMVIDIPALTQNALSMLSFFFNYGINSTYHHILNLTVVWGYSNHRSLSAVRIEEAFWTDHAKVQKVSCLLIYYERILYITLKWFLLLQMQCKILFLLKNLSSKINSFFILMILF